ncbi:hypothetical protein BaRGS_00003122 [Batillaria attramentaria]|uniref:Uncharacterized protein n=1 Tax=Batillaria attramentaria TaxID=370345 RepID=A0ABD0M2W3_9CAEN
MSRLITLLLLAASVLAMTSGRRGGRKPNRGRFGESGESVLSCQAAGNLGGNLGLLFDDVQELRSALDTLSEIVAAQGNEILRINGLFGDMGLSTNSSSDGNETTTTPITTPTAP